MERHIQVLGALFLVLGLMNLIGIATVLFVFGLGSAILGAVAAQEPDFPTVVAFVPILFSFFLAALIALTTIPNLVAGYGLLARKSWANVVALIVGIINLPAFPFGTGVGAYAIWVFLQQDKDFTQHRPG